MSPVPAMNLFAYGTLMDPEIMRAVCGTLYESERAELSGYVRKRVSGEVYPAIAQHDGASVSGIVYRDLPPVSFERLDRFEGELYVRTPVMTRGVSTERLAACAYVLSPAERARLSREDWSLEVFLESGKPVFVRTHAGFRTTLGVPRKGRRMPLFTGSRHRAL